MTLRKVIYDRDDFCFTENRPDSMGSFFEIQLIQIQFCFINRLLGISLLIIKKKLINL